MGLFSRKENQETEDDFESIDLPTSDDINEDFLVDDNEPTISEPVSDSHNRVTQPPKKLEYDIEDAIELMRNLPKESNELVVTVMNRTLMSMNIQIEDIIESAQHKEQRILNDNAGLEGEVESLEAQIAEKKQQMAELMADLDETQEVTKRLNLALELEEKLNRDVGRAKVERPELTQEVSAVPDDIEAPSNE